MEDINNKPQEGQVDNISAFISEYEALKNLRVSTSDPKVRTRCFNEMPLLSGKYGIDSQDYKSYVILFRLSSKQQIGTDGQPCAYGKVQVRDSDIVAGRVDAARYDGFVREGRFTDALRLVKDSLEDKALSQWQGSHSFMGELVRSDRKNGSELLGIHFDLHREDGEYVVRCNPQAFANYLKNRPDVLQYYQRDLKAIEREWFGGAHVEGFDNARSQERSQSAGIHR